MGLSVRGLTHGVPYVHNKTYVDVGPCITVPWGGGNDGSRRQGVVDQAGGFVHGRTSTPLAFESVERTTCTVGGGALQGAAPRKASWTEQELEHHGLGNAVARRAFGRDERGPYGSTHGGTTHGGGGGTACCVGHVRAVFNGLVRVRRHHGMEGSTRNAATHLGVRAHVPGGTPVGPTRVESMDRTPVRVGVTGGNDRTRTSIAPVDHGLHVVSDDDDGVYIRKR